MYFQGVDWEIKSCDIIEKNLNYILFYYYKDVAKGHMYHDINFETQETALWSDIHGEKYIDVYGKTTLPT